MNFCLRKLSLMTFYMLCVLVKIPNSPLTVYEDHINAIETLRKKVSRTNQVSETLICHTHYGRLFQIQTLAKIINCLLDFCLFQINSIPNEYDKMLDLVFVRDSFEFSVIRHTPVGNPEDKYHPTLEINFFHRPFCQANTSTQTPKIYCFHLTNRNKLHCKP